MNLLEHLPIGIILTDENDNVTYVNQNLAMFGITDEVRGVKRGDAIGIEQLLGSVITKEDLGHLHTGAAVERELKRITTTSGKEIALLLKAVPLADDGQYKGAALLIEDIPYSVSQKTDELIYSDETFSSIIQSLWSLFVIASVEGKILYIGGKKVGRFAVKGAKRSDALHAVFNRDLSNKIVPLFRAILLQARTEEFLLDLPSAENPNDTEYFECFLTPLYVESLKSSVVLFSVREITTFLKMIETLKQENTELKQHYEFTGNISQAVIALTQDNKIHFWNQAAEKIFKFRRSEVFAKPVQRVFPGLNRERLSEISRQARRKGQESFVEPLALADGEARIIHITAYFTGENESYLVLLAEDKTEQEHTAGELMKNLHIQTEFFQSLNIPALIADQHGRVTVVNAACAERFGQIGSKELSLKIDDYVRVSSAGRGSFDFLSTDFTVPTLVDAVLMDTAGTEFPCECQFRKTVLPDGSALILVTLTDLSSPNALKYELEMLRSIFDFSNDGIALEYQDNFILVNEAFALLYGYASPAELIGNNSLKIVAEEEIKKVQDFRAEKHGASSKGIRYEFLAKRKDESRFFAEVTLTGFQVSGRNYNVILARDVTERKRQQQAIKESEERYRSITENIDDFFWTAERAANWLKPIFYTASVEKITGYSQIELLGDLKLFLRLIYPDDFKMYKDKLKRFFGNFYKRTEEIEFRILNKQGGVVWIRNKMNVVRNRKGKVLKLFGLVSDITLQKKAEEELRHSTDELRKLNETKDKFISIISHDLRTPFSSILGFTDILLNEDDLTPEESRQYVHFIQEASTNMLNLVNSLLDWTRIQTGRMQFEPVNIDLREIVDSAFKALSGVAMKKGINLFNEIENETMVFVDKGLLLQVFGNLVSNALKFTPEGGGIFIRATQAEQPRFLKVDVMDTGVGIKPENLDKIFNVDAKFTTVGTSGEKGTGLGLSFVREIVEKHGGKIWVESQPGNGTVFSFLAPKASATILLVDDSQTDRILYSKILKSIVEDYEIITAENGKEALEIISKSAPSLIISDHSMPVMDGLQFMAKYSRLQMKGKPPVIILSSELGRSEQLAYADMGLEFVFSKPVNLTSLKKAVEKCLKKMPK